MKSSKRRTLHRYRTAGSPAFRSRAFTLLEVMLALALSVVLLGGIYAAMDQSWKLTSVGREEMERSQLARALIRKISLDVRAIAFVPPVVSDADSASGSSSSGTSSSGGSSTSSGGSSSGSSTGSASSSSGSTSSSSGTSTSGTSTTDETPSATSIGIRGNAQRIEMHISRARRDLDFSANLDGNKLTTHNSDLRVVTYQLGLTGTPSGLIRTEGDRLATVTAESNGAAPTIYSGQQALSPEVNSLQFRFFDGRAWYTTWDSSQTGRLPRAVEVIIGFAPARIRPGPALRVNVSSSVNQVRSVILIPIADPLPEEFVQ